MLVSDYIFLLIRKEPTRKICRTLMRLFFDDGMLYQRNVTSRLTASGILWTTRIDITHNQTKQRDSYRIASLAWMLRGCCSLPHMNEFTRLIAVQSGHYSQESCNLVLMIRSIFDSIAWLGAVLSRSRRAWKRRAQRGRFLHVIVRMGGDIYPQAHRNAEAQQNIYEYC